MKLTVLVEDSVRTTRRDLTAKHGLSFLIECETEGSRFYLLMDTGPSDVILQNSNAMGINLAKIDAIFLSHGHYDHTGELIDILKSINKRTPVIAHPKIFNPKLKLTPAVKSIGIPFKPAEVEAHDGILLLAQNSVKIAKDVITTGKIERLTRFEKVEDYWTIEEERFVKDIMPDDQALIIQMVKKGLVIVSGCAHSGIINTVEKAQKVTDIDEIYAVLGGFHLSRANAKTIHSTVQGLSEIDPQIVAPCHCTGSEAIQRLVEHFNGRCRPLKTGDTTVL